MQQCSAPENFHTPPQKGLEFLEGGGESVRPKIRMKLIIGISRGVVGGGVPRKNPFHRGGIELHILWNYTCSEDDVLCYAISA